MTPPTRPTAGRGPARAPSYRSRPTPAPVPGGSETILVVEDDAAVRQLARRVLELAGYTVIEARHGKEALELATAERRRIDLLLSDAVMPLMVGGELARSLRVLRPHLKVLFMSRLPAEEAVSRGLMDADDALLEKPFAPDAIARRVRDALDGVRGRPTWAFERY